MAASTVSGPGDLNDFPVSDYYKDRVREARTISRTGLWWAAVLLIEDPRTEQLFLKFYRWQKRNGNWRVNQSFSCRSKQDCQKLVSTIVDLGEYLS